jgi:hypothetical protein
MEDERAAIPRNRRDHLIDRDTPSTIPNSHSPWPDK